MAVFSGNGSSASPSFTFSSSTSTGIYRGTNPDEIRLCNNGTDTMVLTAGRNVGIRNTNPLHPLHLTGTAAITPAQSAGSRPLLFNHAYGVYVDNTGDGSDNTRLWLDTPDQGQVVIGPRAGGDVLFGVKNRTEAVSFEEAGTAEYMRLQAGSSRGILRGRATGLANVYLGGTLSSPMMQLWSSTSGTSRSHIFCGAATSAGYITLSRGDSSNPSALGNSLGILNFTTWDGVDKYRSAAWIVATCADTPTATSTPGRVLIYTTPTGSTQPVGHFLVDEFGRVIVGAADRNAVTGTDDQFAIQGLAYQARHYLDSNAYTIGQNSNSRGLRIGSGATYATVGVSLAAGATSWGTYSDERLKKDIEELSGCLEDLTGVRCVTYRLKDVDGPEDSKRLGVIAQDLVGKFDEAVGSSKRGSGEDETEYLEVRYAELVPVLIKALQEATARIEALEAAVGA